jgi:hypothetical protein
MLGGDDADLARPDEHLSGGVQDAVCPLELEEHLPVGVLP